MSAFLALLFLLTLSLRRSDGLREVHQSSIVTEDKLSHVPKKNQEVSVRISELDTVTIRLYVWCAVSQQPLSQVSIDVFANYTLIISTKTSHDGSSVLSIPYIQGRELSIVASKNGYIQTALPWKTTKMPIFSSVTLSLFSQNQGNIWLFEDVVLITGKTSDATTQPKLQFPKSLLSLPESNISFLTAYLTGPQLAAEQHYMPYTTGIIISKSGYRSIPLKPVAAVSVQLLYNGEDVQVTGPIHITLPLPESSQSEPSETIPAWSFSRKTGTWVNHGLGIVQMEYNHLVWAYTAPHLGYWIAAPFPLPTGYTGQESNLGFIHTYLLMAALAGTLGIAVGLLCVVSCYCRNSLCKSEEKRFTSTTKAVQKKNQTTCTNSNDHLDIYFKELTEDRSHLNACQSTCQRDQPVSSAISRNFTHLEKKSMNSAFQICEDLSKRAAALSEPSQQPSLNIKNGEMTLNENMFLPERLVLYNHPVAILQVPDHFDQNRSSTLPRKVVQYENLETFTHTLPKLPLLSDLQQQLIEETQTMEIPNGALGLSSNQGSFGCFNSLLESVSVPGVLNKTVGMDILCGNNQGTSEQTLLELSKRKPFPHPKAWFVSLEGKPAAQVRHSIVDLRRCHLYSNSDDTSLDSGVDLTDQQSGQKYVRNMPHSQSFCSDVDLNTSQNGTIPACSPTLKNTLQSSSSRTNAIEARQIARTSNSHESSERASSPPVNRFRTGKEKSQRDKSQNTWNNREERQLMKLS